MSKIYAMKLDAIANDKSMIAASRHLAKLAMEKSYLSFKEMLEELSNIDLQTLISLQHFSNTPDDRGQVFVYSLVFATVEGSVLLEHDKVDEIVNQVCALLVFESMRRHDLVDLDIEKFSFGSSLVDVVKPKNGFEDRFQSLTGMSISDALHEYYQSLEKKQDRNERSE